MAAFVDSMFPINFNTHVMSIEMATATQMLEEAGYHFVYIQRLKSIQTTLENGKSKNVTLGNLKEFSKTFKQAFAKGINPETANIDIVRVFSKIAAICTRKENVENECLRSEKVKQYVKEKINKRRQNWQNKQQQPEHKQQEQQQEMDDNINGNGDNDGDDDSQGNHDERDERDEREEKSMELLQNTSHNDDRRGAEHEQDDNERVIRQERKIDQEYGEEEDDMNVIDMEKDFSNLNIGDNGDHGDNDNDSKSNNDDNEKCESLLYWQKVEKTTKKEIKIGMTLSRKNFPHLESKLSLLLTKGKTKDNQLINEIWLLK